MEAPCFSFYLFFFFFVLFPPLLPSEAVSLWPSCRCNGTGKRAGKGKWRGKKGRASGQRREDRGNASSSSSSSSSPQHGDKGLSIWEKLRLRNCGFSETLYLKALKMQLVHIGNLKLGPRRCEVAQVSLIKSHCGYAEVCVFCNYPGFPH